MTGFANTKKWLNNLLQQGLHMAKFATTSLVATTVDYTLYLLLVDRVLAPEWANIVSYSTSAVINFLLQRRFIFDLRRPA